MDLKKAFIILLLFFTANFCARQIKEEIILKPPVDINGRWQRGERSTVIINDYTGKILGNNGAEIDINVKYYTNGFMKITEIGHTPEFIANYVPIEVARQIFTNEMVTNTFFSLRKTEPGSVSVFVNAWQVYYDGNYEVYYIVPYTNTERWIYIEEIE